MGGKVYLYKGGTEGAANTGNEPYSEFYAAQIAAAMGVHAIPYGLSRWKGVLCSTCELFTSKEYAYLPKGVFVLSIHFRNSYSSFSYSSFKTRASLTMP